jgi:hypothetical protein
LGIKDVGIRLNLAEEALSPLATKISSSTSIGAIGAPRIVTRQTECAGNVLEAGTPPTVPPNAVEKCATKISIKGESHCTRE